MAPSPRPHQAGGFRRPICRAGTLTSLEPLDLPAPITLTSAHFQMLSASVERTAGPDSFRPHDQPVISGMSVPYR